MSFSIPRKKSDFFMNFSNIEYGDFEQDPDDNDGFDIKDIDKQGNCSRIDSAVQIANAIMGAGILALPIMMKKLGILLGSFNIIIAALITIYSVKVLLRSKNLTNQYGYSMYGKIAYGTFGSFIVKFAILLSNFTACCAFYKIFGKVSKALVSIIVEKDSYFINNERNHFYVLLLFICMLPLIFKKSIDAFKNFSFLGVVAISIFCISLLVLLILEIVNGTLPELNIEMLFPSEGFVSCLSITTSVFLAFSFQILTFPIYFSLKKRSDQQMQTATKLGVGFCTFVYLFSSIIAMILFSKEKIIDTVLENFEQILNNPKASLTIHIITTIVLFCFLISATMSIPLIFFSFKYTVLNLVLFLKKNYSKNNKQNPEEYLNFKEEISNNQESSKDFTNNDNTTNEKLIGESERENIDKLTVSNIEENNQNFSNGESTKLIILSNCEEKIWTFSCYVSIIIVTLLIEKLEIIFDIGGFTGANLIGLILPNLFLIKLLKVRFLSSKLVINKLILLLGFCIFVLGVTFLFVNE